MASRRGNIALGEKHSHMTNFQCGDIVRTRSIEPLGHTRLPGYLRGKRGRIIAVAGTFPLADECARGIRDAAKEMVYSVRFNACDVWEENVYDFTITADLWESYLESIR